MNHRKLKLGLIPTLSLICISTVIILSYAYFTSSSSVINTVNVGDVDIEVSEEFKPPSNWDGKEYPKVVKIHNKSKSPALIRVALIPRWVDENGKPWPGDTNFVHLEYDLGNIISPISTDPKNKWVNGEDGYHYYNTIVPKDGMTVEILKSVEAKIPPEQKDRYKDKTLIVDVKAEAVQASKDAHRKTWSNIASPSKLQEMLDSLCDK